LIVELPMVPLSMTLLPLVLKALFKIQADLWFT